MADDDLEALGVRHSDGLDTGTGVPHFALNILDYKLWWLSEIEGRSPEGLPVVKVSGFRFAYRTSIEHFLPSNLAEREDRLAVVNDFGNLCLMTRTENSRRSDHTPDWKVEKYGESDQSLKFHYMAALQREAKEWGPRQISSQGADDAEGAVHSADSLSDAASAGGHRQTSTRMDFDGRAELEKPIPSGAPSGAYRDNQPSITIIYGTSSAPKEPGYALLPGRYRGKVHAHDVHDWVSSQIGLIAARGRRAGMSNSGGPTRVGSHP